MGCEGVGQEWMPVPCLECCGYAPSPRHQIRGLGSGGSRDMEIREVVCELF